MGCVFYFSLLLLPGLLRPFREKRQVLKTCSPRGLHKLCSSPSTACYTPMLCSTFSTAAAAFHCVSVRQLHSKERSSCCRHRGIIVEVLLLGAARHSRVPPPTKTRLQQEPGDPALLHEVVLLFSDLHSCSPAPASPINSCFNAVI